MTSSTSPLACKICSYFPQQSRGKLYSWARSIWWETLTGFYTILVSKAECHSVHWKDTPNCSRQVGLATHRSPSGFLLQLSLHPQILHTYPSSIMCCIHLPILLKWHWAQWPHVYEHQENRCVFSSMDRFIFLLPWRLSPVGSQTQPH